MFWSILALAASIFSASANKPVSAAELVAAHKQPFALAQAMGKQCAHMPTELACFVFQLKVHHLATEQQRMAVDQRLAPTASFMGRYRDAARYNPLREVPRAKPVEPPLPQRGFHAVSAADAVAQLARDRDIVMVNEYHMDASTRQLTLALLPRLYREGFRYLAVEALWESGAQVAERGYVTSDSGYYTREPVFADLLARAVELGYTLVPYDASGAPDVREAAQAHNIFNKIFAKDPDARVLIHAGHGHIDENPGGFSSNIEPMAMQLHELTGTDPLTVDQTRLRSHAPGHGPQLWQNLVRAYSPDAPTVLLGHNDQPWSADSDKVDVSVLMPVQAPGPDRPSWLTLGGQRQRVQIDASWCDQSWPCEVAAWPLHQPSDAIPADRYALLDPKNGISLFLYPGRYRIQAHDIHGKLITSHGITIKENPAP